jgi:hypothetical protein
MDYLCGDRLVIQQDIILRVIRNWETKISQNCYVPVLRILRGWPICLNVLRLIVAVVNHGVWPMDFNEKQK